MQTHVLRDGDRTVPVSALCLGTMMFGTTIDTDTAFAILDRYLEAGGSFLDTANCYSFWAPGGVGGESERVIGDWLRDRGVRDRITIATKVGAGIARPDEPYDAHNREGLSAATIRREVDDSLYRLDVDRIDLLYTHADDRATPLQETLAALHAEVDADRVGTLAASNHTAWRLALARDLSARHGWARYAAVQLRHTHLDPRPLRGPVTDEIQLPVTPDIVDQARHDGDLALLGYSPLIGGAYTRDDRPIPEVYDHPGTPERIRVLGKVAAELDATPNQVVLARMLAHDPPILPVIGVSSVAQLDEALGALDLHLDDELATALDA